MALRRSSFMEDGKLSSYMSIITGPSRTGDIEQTIVIGAHGPRQVHMLIVDSETTSDI
jgi:L-lactate dehydrogenase complex protein LldG